jgi:DNA mismatch repair ATPase MutS
VLERARALLSLFEGEQIVSALGHRSHGGEKGPSGKSAKRKAHDMLQDQLALFGSTQHPIVEELKHLDPNQITPVDALMLLNRLVDRAKQG